MQQKRKEKTGGGEVVVKGKLIGRRIEKGFEEYEAKMLR